MYQKPVPKTRRDGEMVAESGIEKPWRIVFIVLGLVVYHVSCPQRPFA
jgi:hypothetical protein